MDVRSIHIERFKSIQDLQLPLKRITVLAGPNNAGKSSVLQAVQFATSIAQSAKTYGSGLSSGTLASEQLLYSPLRDVAALAPGMRFTQKAANEIKISVAAEIIAGTVDSCIIRVRRGKNANVSYNVTENDLGLKMAEITNPFSVLVTGLAGIPRQEEWRSEGLVRKAAARGDANSVLRNVLWLLRGNPTDWLQFQSDIESVFPGLALNVDFDPGIDDFINVTFPSGPANLPIDALGTGVLQTIQILSYVNVYKPELLLLDEPDSHLHPNNQRALARLLVKLSTDRSFQIVLTTHSRHFLDELHGLAEVYWFSDGKIAAEQFDVIQALVDLGALDAVDVFAAKDVVFLTEDTDMSPIRALAEAAGADLTTVVFRSFSGCSNLSSTFPVVDFIRSHAPQARVVVHRDRDYETDAAVSVIVSELEAAGIKAMIPGGVDIESCFILAEHVTELYPEIPKDQAQQMIEAATIAAQAQSEDRMVQRRVQQIGRKTKGGINNVDIPKVLREATAEYHADVARFRYGKSVLGNLIAEIQRVIGRHVDIFRPSEALRNSREAADLRQFLADNA